MPPPMFQRPTPEENASGGGGGGGAGADDAEAAAPAPPGAAADPMQGVIATDGRTRGAIDDAGAVPKAQRTA